MRAKSGEYGALWSKKCKGSSIAMPTVREILDGLQKFLDIMVDDRAQDQPKYRARTIKYQYSCVFQKILEILSFKNIDEPINHNRTEHGENSIRNPNSKAVCLILWLFTIEPPFYTAVNKACSSH